MRGIDEYMRGTGRLLRAGVEKIWGPGRHMAGNNTFSYFLDPHGNTVEYTTELEQVDEDTWHPHLYDFTQPEVSRPVGHRQPDERVRRQASRSTTPTGACSSPRRSECGSPPGRLGGRRRGRRGRRRRACTRCRPASRVLDLVRAGLPAALDGRAAALAGPAVPLGGAVRLLPPLAAADGAGLRRLRGARRGRRRAASADGAGVVPEWYEAPTFYFTNPYALVGAHDDVAGPARLAAARLRARGRRRRRPGRRVADPGAGRATTSSATRSSTTGRPGTCSAAR